MTWDRTVGAAGEGAARLANVAHGCFIQEHNVRAGERYAVGAVRKVQGRGNAWIRVRWKTVSGAWTAESQDVLILGDGPPNEWSGMFGAVEVPADAACLVILLGVRGQTTANDVAWYDDVALYLLE